MPTSDDASKERDEALERLLAWIGEQLELGRPEAAIRFELTERGLEESTASEFIRAVQDARSTGDLGRSKPPGVLSKIISTLGGWIVILLGFALLNGVLWAGQELASLDEQREARAIRADLDSLGQEIEDIESRGRARGISAYEQAEYERLIDEYNTLVPRYNSTAEEAYSRWWLLPIPVPSRASRSVRR